MSRLMFAAALMSAGAGVRPALTHGVWGSQVVAIAQSSEHRRLASQLVGQADRGVVAMNPYRLMLMIMFCVGMTVSHAHAHAFLSKSSPPVGSTVRAPDIVAITFTEDVEPAFSTIVVRDAKGQRVDMGEAHSASGNGLVLMVGLKPLTPGTYTVVWHATSVDTHKTEGHFVFTVQP